jgi:hypothetical protein
MVEFDWQLIALEARRLIPLYGGVAIATLYQRLTGWLPVMPQIALQNLG